MSISRASLFVYCVCVLIAISPPSARAGDAFFSEDGQTVTIGLGRVGPGLVKVDIATGRITEVPLPAQLEGEYIESVARGADGETLFLAKDAVWVLPAGGSGPVRRVCATAPVEGATDLFVATVPGTPITDYLFVTGWEQGDTTYRGTFYGRKPGGKKFLPIFCRRVDDASAGIFSANGRLFFASGGDLWEGGLQVDDDFGPDRMGTLVGARIASLAVLNTDEGNSGSLFVSQIAPAGGWIYSQLSGRHMAAIVRSPLPARPLYAPDLDEFPTVETQLEAVRTSLNKTEIIADELDEVFGLCATELGGVTRLFFCSRTAAADKGPAMLLWEDNSTPRIIGYFPDA